MGFKPRFSLQSSGIGRDRQLMILDSVQWVIYPTGERKKNRGNMIINHWTLGYSELYIFKQTHIWKARRRLRKNGIYILCLMFKFLPEIYCRILGKNMDLNIPFLRMVALIMSCDDASQLHQTGMAFNLFWFGPEPSKFPHATQVWVTPIQSKQLHIKSQSKWYTLTSSCQSGTYSIPLSKWPKFLSVSFAIMFCYHRRFLQTKGCSQSQSKWMSWWLVMDPDTP